MTCWSDHFNTYDEACHYYGIDTPAQLEDEGDWRDAEALCEEAFGPYVYSLRSPGLDPIEAAYHAVREARLARGKYVMVAADPGMPALPLYRAPDGSWDEIPF